MQITMKAIPIRDLFNGYQDKGEDGVFGYNGTLDIRPPYQREFIYKHEQQVAVIDTVKKGFPLNVMYWAKKPDGTYEVIDGQQRTLSICRYIDGVFAHENLYFHNLPQDIQDNILNYELQIYICEGTESEKLEWFKTINIAGEHLTDQELRNAVYTGAWLQDAKRHFSKTNCVAYNLGGNYLTGTPIRQDYLETVLKWISKGNIEEYMAQHQHDNDASELWSYFRNVLDWVKETFIEYRKEMKGIAWGELYNEFKHNKYDPQHIEQQIQKLMADEDVTKKKGIYHYVLDGQEKHLSIRSFTPNQKREAYERQKGICPKCNNHFDIKDMEGDHITPWHLGGKTVASNCQMLCKDCNRRKSGK